MRAPVEVPSRIVDAGGRHARSGAAPRRIRIELSDDALEDLKARLGRTRWPDRLVEAGWDYGADFDAVSRLQSHWLDGYDWRTRERALNALPHYVATIDGERVHFVNQRSRRPDAVPLLLIHGWPGSFVEFARMIPPLCDPDDASTPAFHVVVPSLPGFALSGPTRTRGWDPRRMARALARVMASAGHERYVVHGGDWGARIGQSLATDEPDRVIGFHSNFLLAGPPSGASLADLSPEERHALLGYREGEQYGYFRLQETRPQALAFALSDSPTGLLAWFVDKFQSWVDHEGDFLDVVD